MCDEYHRGLTQAKPSDLVSFRNMNPPPYSCTNKPPQNMVSAAPSLVFLCRRSFMALQACPGMEPQSSECTVPSPFHSSWIKCRL